MTWPFILFVAAIVLSGLVIFGYPRWRRARVLARPFPPEWLRFVRQTLPFHHKLKPEEQRQLQDNIRLFIAGKTFHGCGGQEINDEIRVTIAAQACLLLLNRPAGIYPSLRHILVYPDAFMVSHENFNEDGTVSSDANGLSGESWDNGKVILSWEDAKHGVAYFDDGYNVTLHEFAHQLDSESGYTNGAPLMSLDNLQTWAGVFSREFEQLKHRADHFQHSVMDDYGATNPAEFFAVATETFFEKPEPLKSKHPELYEAMCRYYRVDPLQWQ